MSGQVPISNTALWEISLILIQTELYFTQSIDNQEFLRQQKILLLLNKFLIQDLVTGLEENTSIMWTLIFTSQWTLQWVLVLLYVILYQLLVSLKIFVYCSFTLWEIMTYSQAF